MQALNDIGNSLISSCSKWVPLRPPKCPPTFCLGSEDAGADGPSLEETHGARNPEDAQKTFDLLASKDKELFWIEGTARRFKDGYNHFGRHPRKSTCFLR